MTITPELEAQAIEAAYAAFEKTFDGGDDGWLESDPRRHFKAAIAAYKRVMGEANETGIGNHASTAHQQDHALTSPTQPSTDSVNAGDSPTSNGGEAASASSSSNKTAPAPNQQPDRVMDITAAADAIAALEKQYPDFELLGLGKDIAIACAKAWGLKYVARFHQRMSGLRPLLHFSGTVSSATAEKFGG